MRVEPLTRESNESCIKYLVVIKKPTKILKNTSLPHKHHHHKKIASKDTQIQENKIQEDSYR